MLLLFGLVNRKAFSRNLLEKSFEIFNLNPLIFKRRNICFWLKAGNSRKLFPFFKKTFNAGNRLESALQSGLQTGDLRLTQFVSLLEV